MKRLQEIKDEIVSGTNFKRWDEYLTVLGTTNNYAKMELLLDNIAKRYAAECCQASLQKASDNLEFTFNQDHSDFIKQQESITDKQNIILL